MPVYISNLDLEYPAQAPDHRFSNGAFVTCFEALYQKLTNKKLIISDILGKPAKSTYHYAYKVLKTQAEKLNSAPLTEIIGIGDNLHSDIAGPNLAKEEFKEKYKCRIRSALVCTGCFPRPEGATNEELNREEFRQNIGRKVRVRHAPTFLLDRELNCQDNWKFFVPDFVFDDVSEVINHFERK